MKTIDRLRTELARVQRVSPESKIKVSHIAAGVGVSHSTLYNRYPEMITLIKAHNAVVALGHQQSYKAKCDKLKEDKHALKTRNSTLTTRIQKLVSINAKYELENTLLTDKVRLIKKENAKMKQQLSNLVRFKSR